jgi:putative tricarboxylic transport membrane protein
VSVPEPETAGPRAQAIAFGVLMLLGAAVFGTSFGFGILGEEGRVGPGLLPMVTGLLLLLLSAGQLLARLLRDGPGVFRRTARSSEPIRREALSSEPDVDVFGRTETQRVRQLWTVVVALPVAVLLVPLLGFLAALGLLVLFVSAVVERRPPLVAIAVTAVAVAAGYGIFAEFLDVPLPTGAVGDLLGW